MVCRGARGPTVAAGVVSLKHLPATSPGPVERVHGVELRARCRQPKLLGLSWTKIVHYEETKNWKMNMLQGMVLRAKPVKVKVC